MSISARPGVYGDFDALVIDSTSPCGQKFDAVATVVDPLSENPGIVVPRPLGVNAIREILALVERTAIEGIFLSSDKAVTPGSGPVPPPAITNGTPRPPIHGPECTIFKNALTDTGDVIPVGTKVRYLGHVLGGNVRVGVGDRIAVVHPGAIKELV